jgi:hypothetical protein
MHRALGVPTTVDSSGNVSHHKHPNGRKRQVSTLGHAELATIVTVNGKVQQARA